MHTFSLHDLRDRPNELVRDAQAGKLSIVTQGGEPVFVAVPFDEALLRGGVNAALAVKLFDETYTARLNPESFRKAQTMFREAANPVVSISGNLSGNAIEAAGIQVFDKGAKPAAVEAAKPEPAEITPPPSVAEGQRPRLSLKPKTPTRAGIRPVPMPQHRTARGTP